jgi:hypothetical protein
MREIIEEGRSDFVGVEARVSSLEREEEIKLWV